MARGQLSTSTRLLSRCCSLLMLPLLFFACFVVAPPPTPANAAATPPPMTVAFYAVPTSNSSLPPPRCLHYAARSDLASSMYVIAGRSSEPNDSFLSVYSDVWAFTASNSAPQFAPQGVWQQYPSGGDPLPARMGLAGSSSMQIITSAGSGGGSSTKDKSKTVLYVYGGVDSTGAYLDDIWQYDTRPSGGAAPWTRIRAPSSTRSPSDSASLIPPHVTQPSARALTSWQSMSLPYALLVGISRSSLSTPNLGNFLDATSSTPASVTVFVAFGGRSSPSNNYSTTWSTAAQTVSYVNSSDALNADYGDLWWYVASADTWLRIGNLTCLNNTYTCSDYKYMSDVVQGATHTSLSEQVAAVSGNFTLPLRPDSLTAEVLALSTLVGSLNDTLYETLSWLMSSEPNYTTDTPNACTFSCSSLAEIQSSVANNNNSSVCQQGSPVPGGNCGFYSALHPALGVTITQQRPNATEGYASGVYIGARSNTSTFSVYYQFGGFSCAGQGESADSLFPDVYYDASCFSNTLYAMDTSTSSLIWWAIAPPASPSSAVSQQLQWPSARAYAAMAIDSVFGQLWLYGGAAFLGGRWQYYSDVHVLDVVKAVWMKVEVVGNPPLGTYGMSLTYSSLYTNLQHLMLFGGCGGDNPSASNQLWSVQNNWQLQASNWYMPTNTSLDVGAGQLNTLYATAVLSQQQLTPLAFALGVTGQWNFRWTVFDVYGNSILLLPVLPLITDYNNGAYQFNFTIYAGRTAQLSIWFFELAADTYMPVSPTLITYTVEPGPYAAHTTALLFSNYSVVAKLLPATLTIQMHDIYNNPCLTSQGALQLSLFYIDSAEMTGGVVTATNKTRVVLDWVEEDNHDGTYDVTYTAPDVDSYYLYVQINNLLIAGSPFLITALNPLDTPSAIRESLLAVSVTLSAAVFALMLALIHYRDNRVVRAGSPLFLVLICVGVIVSLVSVPVYAYPSNVSCRLFPFLLTTGYVIALSALFTKSYRVLLIFVKHQLNSMALTDGAMLILTLVLVSCETILNVVWLIADPLTLMTFSDTNVLTFQACGGPHSTAFVGVSVAFNGLIALWGVYLALQIRHVPEAFGESKLMGAALYNLALVMAITIPLTWTASNTQSSHEDLVIPSAAIIWCSAATILLVVAPKLYYVLHPPPQHFFDGYDTNGVMVKGVKGRANGHGSDGARNWSDERHEAAELAGFDVRRGGAPMPSKWRKKRESQQAAAAAQQEGELEKDDKTDGEEDREGGEVELRTLKNSPSAQQTAAVPDPTHAPPANLQPLIVEDAPAGFLADNRRNSLSDRRRPAPIRTTVPIPAPPLLNHHQSARSRGRRNCNGSTLTTPRTHGSAGKPHTASTGSAESGPIRVHSPAAPRTRQPSSSSSPPSAHSQRLRHSPHQPTPPSQQRPSPPSRSRQHSRQSSSPHERSAGLIVSGGTIAA